MSTQCICASSVPIFPLATFNLTLKYFQVMRVSSESNVLECKHVIIS